MSEIPYVNQLGDALDAAIRRPVPARRRRRSSRRRYLAVALAAIVVAGGGAAVAEMLTDPAELGLGNVACFTGADTSGEVAMITDPERHPTDVCAAAIRGFDAQDLIACHWEGRGVAVLPRGGRPNCAAFGLAPLPDSYEAARVHVADFERAVEALQRRAGCVPPRRFARRVQALLDRQGWTGWRAVAGGGGGPCGRVSVDQAARLGSIASNVDPRRRTVTVRGYAPLEVQRIVWGSGSPGTALLRTSGERCFTLAGLKEHVRRAFAGARVPVRFRVAAPPRHMGLEPQRGQRYAAGCAIYALPHLTFPDGRTEVVVELWQRGAG